MLKLSFHENGKLESFEVSWKFLIGLLSMIGAFVSGIFTMITKAILIFAIAIQGLFVDPDSLNRPIAG
jgi:hypothetical protein